MEVQAIRTQIPALSEAIYLNTGTFGPMPDVVTREILRAYELIGQYGAFSPIVRQEIEREGFEKVRNTIAKMVNASTDEIALTRSASDGICTIAYGLDWKVGDQVVVTDQEHPSGVLPWINVHRRFGVDVRVVRVADEPAETLQRFSEAITARTRLVFASHVCSTTGERLPVREICKLAHDRGKFAAVDGAHALGEFPVDLTNMRPDFYVMCGHKWLLGPQGTGMLFVAREQIARLAPSWIGWGAQRQYTENLETLSFVLQDSARRFEFATKAWPLYIGLGRAIGFVEEIGMGAIDERVKELSARFKEENTQIPGIQLLTPRVASRSAGLVSVEIPNSRDGDLRELFWDHAHALVSSYEPKRRVRFSIAFFTAAEELNIALDVLRALVK